MPSKLCGHEESSIVVWTKWLNPIAASVCDILYVVPHGGFKQLKDAQILQNGRCLEGDPRQEDEPWLLTFVTHRFKELTSDGNVLVDKEPARLVESMARMPSRWVIDRASGVSLPEPYRGRIKPRNRSVFSRLGDSSSSRIRWHRWGWYLCETSPLDIRIRRAARRWSQEGLRNGRRSRTRGSRAFLVERLERNLRGTTNFGVRWISASGIDAPSCQQFTSKARVWPDPGENWPSARSTLTGGGCLCHVND